jgi:high affinity sulfate transporter 1
MNARPPAWFPAWSWLAAYDRPWLVPDVLAGLTTAAVVIPKAMAYATIAGLPVQVGLYTALVPVVVYALLGTSRVLSVSTTTTLGILCGSAIEAAVPAADAGGRIVVSATLALLVGVILLIARLVRLGFVANFISDPVLIGFKAGVGLVILVDQAPKLLGIHFAKTDWLHSVAQLAAHVPQTSLPTLCVGLGTLVALLLLEHFAPRLPSPLLVVAGGISASYLLDLQAQGVAIVGPIGGGLPRFVAPELSLIERLWAPALAIALMSFTETVAAGRAFTVPGEARPDADQELVATGAANVVGGLFGAMPGGGGTSQTAVNRKAGARTQLSSLASAALALATLLFFAPVMRLLPQATLAAVVIAFSIDLISPAGFRELHAFRTQEFRWALCASAGVVLLGTLNGIVAAVVLSMLGLLRMANNPRVYVLRRKPGTDVFRPVSPEHPEDEAFPGLLVLKTEGRIYFGNAQNVGDRMWPLIHQAAPEVLLLDCGATPNFEFTALKLLSDAEGRLKEDGIELWLAALTPEALEVIQRSPLGQRLGRARMFFTVPQAVDHYLRVHGRVPQATGRAERLDT